MKYIINLIPIDKNQFTFRVDCENENYDLKVTIANPFFNTKEEALEFAKKQLNKNGVKDDDITISNIEI